MTTSDKSAELRTRCPECGSVLKVTRGQLERRSGVARCGKCATVFLADQYLIAGKSTKKTAIKPAKSKPPGVRTSKDAQAAAEKARKPPKAEIADADREAPPSEPPTIDELRQVLMGGPQPRTRPIFWALGITLLSMLLVGQFTFFYRSELIQYPNARPLVLAFCRALRCEVAPKRNIALIELTHTSIAPHPKYQNGLRIRASLVNRAPFPQTFPLIEVSMTDSAGTLLARRSFSAEQYLERRAVGDDMQPNILIRGLLDVTNPEEKAVGYEIRLVAP